jgi:transketolase
MSCVEILVSLYFRVAKIRPEAPLDDSRDRIILSKGHAAASLYASLAERGFFPVSVLKEFAKEGSTIGEHPCRGALPGVECTSGSLGHGLGLAVGMSYALKLDSNPAKVYVVLSDGDCNEGSTWEAALWAPTQDLGHLTAIVDFNRFQATGRSTEITHLEPLGAKWASFGWEVVEAEGHDFSSLTRALSQRRTIRPRVIVAHTIKGKGVSFMENNLEWHYRPVASEDLEAALAELDGS